jgi:murein DD-endopeptidase MepM/ murein hydrolase activator NlpD
MLDKLRGPAAAKAEKLRQAFAEAGLPVERLIRHAEGLRPDKAARPEEDVGGPFVPAPQPGPGGDFERAFASLNNDLSVIDELRLALPFAPLRQPLAGPLEVTSPFGERMDPFFGRPALHTGVDLRGEYGEPIHATAAGMVVVAGPDGGYGNMVEIDHGAGLSTRYGHMSRIDVAVGQSVKAGEVIGQIGSTGRSTGPHLHYEVRVDGVPVDPSRYLNAGRILTAGM